MIKEDLGFCDKNLQFVSILYKKFKIFILVFSTLILLFS